jgi:hypothetical protein
LDFHRDKFQLRGIRPTKTIISGERFGDNFSKDFLLLVAGKTNSNRGVDPYCAARIPQAQ